MKFVSRAVVFLSAISLLISVAPIASQAQSKPTAKAIESAMLTALRAQSSIEMQFVSKQSNQTMTGVQWASHTAALQSINYLGQVEHTMLIGKRLWVNDNSAGLQSMFNATTAQANQWQNVWIEVPRSNSHYKFIVSGLKGESLFAGFLPTGKVKVFGPKHLNGKTVYELVGKTSKRSGFAGYPLAVVVASDSPYLPLGTLVTSTVAGQQFTSTLKVKGYNTKAPVTIAAPTSAVAYNLTGMAG